MQNKSKQLILAGCLAASVAVTGLTGCHTEDRSTGAYMEDRRTADRVEDNLKHDPVYKYRDVRVNVFNGVAQLSGFVDTQNQVHNAAQIASTTPGVRQVINDITLKPQFQVVPAGTTGAMGATGAGVGRGAACYQAPILTCPAPTMTQPGTQPQPRTQTYQGTQRTQGTQGTQGTTGTETNP